MNTTKKILNSTLGLVLFTTGLISAHAADITLAKEVIADQLVSKVISVDAKNHIVVLTGDKGQEVSVQLTDKAKDLANLKAGDSVQATVIHSIVAKLDTDIDKSAPTITSSEELSQATKDNPTPNMNAVRQVNVQLKITHIDLKDHRITFSGPEGRNKTVDVKDPAMQKHLKELKVDQTVMVTYTDILNITTKK